MVHGAAIVFSHSLILCCFGLHAKHSKAYSIIVQRGNKCNLLLYVEQAKQIHDVHSTLHLNPTHVSGILKFTAENRVHHKMQVNFPPMSEHVPCPAVSGTMMMTCLPLSTSLSLIYFNLTCSFDQKARPSALKSRIIYFMYFSVSARFSSAQEALSVL